MRHTDVYRNVGDKFWRHGWHTCHSKSMRLYLCVHCSWWSCWPGCANRWGSSGGGCRRPSACGRRPGRWATGGCPRRWGTRATTRLDLHDTKFTTTITRRFGARKRQIYELTLHLSAHRPHAALTCRLAAEPRFLAYKLCAYKFPKLILIRHLLPFKSIWLD